MKNKKLLEKYFAEKDRKKQLSILKKYMLSVPADELQRFMLAPMDFLEQALNDPSVSEARKKKIFDNLDEMIFLMKGKLAS